MSVAALHTLLVKRVPGLGRYKRMASAAWQAGSKARCTYSQHGEDRFLLEMLKNFRLDDGIYIDVGANHPMTLSNTYLLYRMGLRGIVIDPVSELIELHRRFRRRDLALCAACGTHPAVAEFTVSKAPVFSRFGEIDSDMVWRKELVPIVTLDMIIATCDPAWIYFVNIDVEGHDLKVLEGAINALERVFLLCVETNTDQEKAGSSRFLEQRNFDLIAEIGCNCIYKNQSNYVRQLLEARRIR